MKRSPFIVAACLIAAVGFTTSQSYIFAGDMGWEKPRQPDDPIDGYWYYNRDGSSGCFENLIVYEAKGPNFRQIFDGYNQNIGIKAVAGSEPYIEMRVEPRVVSRYYIKDLGQQLWAYRFEQIKGGEVSSEPTDQPLFTTCDKPTASGVLMSLMSGVFDPRKPTKRITRKYDL